MTSRATRLSLAFALALVAALVLAGTPSANAASSGAVRTLHGFSTGGTLGACDDCTSGSVPLGFTVNYFGSRYSSLIVNNNGNVTFDGGLSSFTPEPLVARSNRMVAPFWADVDTRAAGSVSWGRDVIDGHKAFAVTWRDVGYYDARSDKLNTFQVVFIDRSETGVGNFDMEFNYDRVQWETGDISGGRAGLGGSAARAGYSYGAADCCELAGSALSGSFLDSSAGADGLTSGSLATTQPGRYLFEIRDATIHTNTKVKAKRGAGHTGARHTRGGPGRSAPGGT